MSKQQRWVIDVNERELRCILSAFDIARDQIANSRYSWWHSTQYADKLYRRLRDWSVAS